jgi:hypothetical protein
MEEWKFLTLPQLELRSLDRPARSQSLYRLRYRGIQHKLHSLELESWPNLRQCPDICLEGLKTATEHLIQGSWCLHADQAVTPRIWARSLLLELNWLSRAFQLMIYRLLIGGAAPSKICYNWTFCTTYYDGTKCFEWNGGVMINWRLLQENSIVRNEAVRS